MKLWRNTLESNGFRFSGTKTEYMRCDFSTTAYKKGDVYLKGQVMLR